MHPAYSIILFTTASGAGYGLLFLLGILGAAGTLPAERWLGAAGLGLALFLVTSGLLASTFHLGHPERAWCALSQWRSSWLSREGMAALFTYLPAVLYGVGWIAFEQTAGLWAAFGVLAAAGAAVTVYCTGMIYASLRTIPQWHTEWVVPGYLLLALASGALLLNLLIHLLGVDRPLFPWLAVAGLAAALALKLVYWRAIEGAGAGSDIGTATGLDRFGPVRPLDAPHTQANYLMKEMGYRIARKHAHKLRRYATILAFAIPIAVTIATAALEGPLAAALAVGAVLSAAFGLVLERWLFFAEAQHVVMLFYGRGPA
jgi:DMSO reductase anchor subunit